ncbi:MAG: hypothetical protein KC609_15385 [Myxococcales bacterium]|nr:hypothetical protein [Myxococcales bacterium]
MRQAIGREEFDYQALMNALSHLANPREKVTALLRKGVIVRVKKGLYVFGDAYRRRAISRELLANWIYGPSLVSLDYALSYHGLIPERVPVLTSSTTKGPKRFETPLGRFVYRQIPTSAFHLGLDRREVGDVAFLIATPERALADKVRDQRKNPLRSLAALATFLFDDLRIDSEAFAQLDASFFETYGGQVGSNKVTLCAALIRQLRGAR